MKSKKSAVKSTVSTAKKISARVEEAAVQPVAVAAQPVVKKSVVKKPVANKTALSVAKAAPSAAKEVKVAKQPKAEKKPKLKVVRDSFTMPQNEYQKIAEIKALCLKGDLHVKKSEILRAGLQALSAMGVEQMSLVLKGLEKIKTGRPNKH